MKLEFSQQILKKYSNIKFPENLHSGSPDVQSRQAHRRTDRQDKANSPFFFAIFWICLKQHTKNILTQFLKHFTILHLQELVTSFISHFHSSEDFDLAFYKNVFTIKTT
jgi:hypothetical protein